MKDGYYWARLNPKKFGDLGWDWDIVKVEDPYDEGQVVIELGNELDGKLGDFEFGDKIEIPEKYQQTLTTKHFR